MNSELRQKTENRIKLVIIAACFLMIASTYAQAQSKFPVRISEIRAHLVYDETGDLSPNIFDGKFTLWNVMIGGGSTLSDSSSTLIFVVLSAEGNVRQLTPLLPFLRNPNQICG